VVTNSSDRNTIVGDVPAGICNVLFRALRGPLHLDGTKQYILQQIQEIGRLPQPVASNEVDLWSRE
jgi:hypothetical protein